MVVDLSMPVVDELRQDVSRRVAARQDLILLRQALPQVLGLDLELPGHFLTEGGRNTQFEQLSLGSPTFGPDLQQVGGIPLGCYS